MFTHMYSTQIPHAVGTAYSLKMDKKGACAVTYFGDGGSSEVIIQLPKQQTISPFTAKEVFLGFKHSMVLELKLCS